MNRALAACLSCGFVTRRHSHIGAGGRCPKCSGPLTETTLTEARRLALERRGPSRPSDQAAKLRVTAAGGSEAAGEPPGCPD